MRFANLKAISRKDKAHHKKLLLMIAMLTLAALACFSQEILIVFDEAGNGDGVIYMTLSLPSEMFIDPDMVPAVIDDLENDGWNEVTMSESGDMYLFSGFYPFATDPAGNTLSDIFPDLTIKIEEAENEYRYFTVEGELDFTEMSESWDEIENSWAKEGVNADFELFGFEEDEEIFSAEDIQALINKYGEPFAIVRIQMPGQTPVEASAAWNNREDYMNGKTNTLEFTWNPDVRLVTPVKAVRRIEPLTYVSEAEANAQITSIIKMYQSSIQNGRNYTGTNFSGFLNNWLIEPFAGGNHTCSDYQGQVIHFLDTIRTSPDEDERKLLNGLDYGPIDTNHEGHLAVVLYQRGTDWRTTGIVLDPWMTQTPQAYPIATWPDHVWGYDATSPNPDHESGHLYPHLSGGTPSYPAAGEFEGDLSPEKNLAKPTTVLYIGSPVTPLLTMPDGKQVGVLPDGTFVNDFGSGVNFYSQPILDGSGGTEWLFLLPDTDFKVIITGTAEGEFHTYVGDASGIYEYGAQEISDGGEASLAVSSTDGPQDMVLENGTLVEAVEASMDGSENSSTEDEKDFVQPTDVDGEVQPTYDGQNNTNLLKYAIVLLCCFSALVIVVLIILGVVLYKRRKK